MAKDSAAHAVTLPIWFTVYHADTLFVPCHWPSQYDLMAHVRARNVEEVFRLTNHADCDWTTHRAVRLIGDGPFRSTSVGDVVVDGYSRAFLCDRFGWIEIKGACSVFPGHSLLRC